MLFEYEYKTCTRKFYDWQARKQCWLKSQSLKSLKKQYQYHQKVWRDILVLGQSLKSNHIVPHRLFNGIALTQTLNKKNNKKLIKYTVSWNSDCFDTRLFIVFFVEGSTCKYSGSLFQETNRKRHNVNNHIVFEYLETLIVYFTVRNDCILVMCSV